MSELVTGEVFNRLPERYRNRARQIAARVAEIDAVLARAQPTAVGDAVLRLRSQLRPQPDIALTEVASEFRVACSDLPEWAISEAANDYLAGRVENHTGQFMPTCAEFARHARSIIRPFIAERASLKNEAERLLQRAEDEARRNRMELERADPKMKERIADLVSSVRAGAVKAHNGQPHQGITDDTRQKLDALRKPRPDQPSRLFETRVVKGAQVGVH
ncbi:hypothetical protein AU381_01725 [Sinorhizobium glycinis]|uniref:Uncharacterized protein n=1 Tax=Sinorhizobium glycinis TaxID=1472378 RepID=A0A178Y0Y9_9HYPH|nr:hypothetical protein [Sinorhizobium glycinis]OAP40653.1 hypothetical protein AU381_01725 [Sinorhizobium glycinis]